MIAKQIMFWLWAVIAIFGFVGGATLYQFLPVFLIMALIGADIWGGKKVLVPVIVTSVIMLIVNIGLESIEDVAFWGATLAIYLFSKK